MQIGPLSWLLVAALALLANNSPAEAAGGPQAFNVLVLYSGSGIYAGRGNIQGLAKVWQQRVNGFLATQLLDPVYKPYVLNKFGPVNWPINFTFVYHDVQSDINQVRDYLYQPSGVLNTTSLPIHAVLGPEGDLGLQTSLILKSYPITNCTPTSIPVFLPISPVVDPTPYTNTYFTLPSPTVPYEALLQQYSTAGAQTVAVVSYTDGLTLDDVTSCTAAANSAPSYGLRVVFNATINPLTSRSEIDTMLSYLAKQVVPDLVIWCQKSACVANSTQLHPMTHFQRNGYMSPGLSLPGCVSQNAVTPTNVDMRFVTAPVYTSANLLSEKYNEQPALYSSKFVPNSTSQSSLSNFYAFYQNLTGSSADDQAVAVWATIDLLEALAWRITSALRNIIVTFPQTSGLSTYYQYNVVATTASMISGYTVASQVSTPLGLFVLSSSNVNSAIQPLLLQVDNNVTDQLVAPSTVATAAFVYPAPTFAERQYQWTLVSTNQQIVSAVIVCMVTALLLAFSATTFVQRSHPEIRMLHWGHIVAGCLSSIVFCWGLLLTWQADNNAAQCHTQWWITFLPAAFTLALIDAKAYRLALFLQNTSLKPPNFSHNKVLMSALALTAVTAVVVGIAVAVGDVSSSVVVIDSNRASLNYYTCSSSSAATALLITLCAVHIVISLLAVLPVRNGMESFRDGAKLKDSFATFYLALVLVWIISLIGLDVQTMYVFRTVALAIGSALLHTSLLGSRMIKFWLSDRWYGKLEQMYEAMQKITAKVTGGANSVTTANTFYGGGGTSRATYLASHFNEESPIYDVAAPTTETIQQMWVALSNPERRKVFEQVAREALALESIEFIDAVNEYRTAVKQAIQMSIDGSRPMVIQLIQDLHKQYVRVGAEKEINISSTVKGRIETTINMLQKNLSPMVAQSVINRILEEMQGESTSNHVGIYDGAINEVGLMMYQNLWSKFTARELQGRMGDNVAG